MTQGRKTGGRQKGTRNKRTTELIDRVAEAFGPDFDPVIEIIRLGIDHRDDAPEFAEQCFRDAAPYVRPKLRDYQHVHKDQEGNAGVLMIPLNVKQAEHWTEATSKIGTDDEGK